MLFFATLLLEQQPPAQGEGLCHSSLDLKCTSKHPSWRPQAWLADGQTCNIIRKHLSRMWFGNSHTWRGQMLSWLSKKKACSFSKSSHHRSPATSAAGSATTPKSSPHWRWCYYAVKCTYWYLHCRGYANIGWRGRGAYPCQTSQLQKSPTSRHARSRHDRNYPTWKISRRDNRGCYWGREKNHYAKSYHTYGSRLGASIYTPSISPGNPGDMLDDLFTWTLPRLAKRKWLCYIVRVCELLLW